MTKKKIKEKNLFFNISMNNILKTIKYNNIILLN